MMIDAINAHDCPRKMINCLSGGCFVLAGENTYEPSKNQKFGLALFLPRFREDKKYYTGFPHNII